MDNELTIEIIKLVGAILVALIGAGGAIYANIIKVRGDKEIQILKEQIERLKSQNSGSELEKEKLEALGAKKQDIAQRKHKINVYIIPISLLFIVLGVFLNPLLIRIITPTPHSCPYKGMTDNETIVNLIQEEAIASNSKGISIIQDIFDPGAIFYDFTFHPTKSWNGPLARYKDDLFKTTDFRNVEHFDILPVNPGISGDIAYYTSGSKGDYRIDDGAWNTFFNGSLVSTPSTKYGSEHWILKKNNIGCWAIVQMEFNAGHVKFPE